MDLLDPCSHKYPILERRGDYVLKKSMCEDLVVYRNFRFTAIFMRDGRGLDPVYGNDTRPYDKSDIELAFKASEKLVTLLELIKYNFDEYMTWRIEYKNIVCFNGTFALEMHGHEVWVCNSITFEIIHKYNVLATDLYDIINHPLLQTYRIIHSKPIITFE